MNKSKIQKHRFYNLRYIIQNTHQSQSFTIPLILFYLLAYTLQLLLLKDISLINFNLSLTQIPFYCLLAIISFLILQSIVFMLAQKQMLLSLQYKIFRYVLMDFGINYIIKQVINYQSSLSYFDATVFIVYILFCIFVCKILCLQQYHLKTLIKESSNHSLYLFAMNLVLQLREFTNWDILKSGLIILFYIITFFSIQLQDNICSEKYEKNFIAVVNRLNIIVGIYLISKSLLLNLQDSLIFYILLLIVYSLITVLLRSRKTNLLEFYQKDLNTLSTSQYLLKMQKFAFSIERIIKGDKNVIETEFKGFLSYHNQSCNMPNCPLFGEEAKGQLRSLQQSKSIKNLAQKAKRHLQLVISLRARMFSEDIDLNLAYLQFIVSYTNNKRKAEEVYNSLDENAELRSEYRLFELKNRINQLSDQDTLLNKKIPQMQYNQFVDNFELTLESVASVCELLTQQQIDFSLLASSLIQMNKQKTFFQRYMESILKMQTFNAYKMLKMYSLLNSQIFNDKIFTQQIDTHIESLVEKLDQKKSIQIISNRAQIGLIAISLSESSLGNITSANECALSIFGFQQKQLIGETVNNIMPDIFAYYHDSLLKVFLGNRAKKVNGDERVLIGKNKNGYIFPVMLRLQRAIVSAQQLIFVANIRRYKTKQTPLMFITSPEGQVIDYTSGFQFYFMRKHNKRVKKLNIFQLVPNFDQCIINQTKYLNICHQYKKGEQISAQFKVTPLAFFGNIEAYYFFGIKVRQTSVSSSSSNIVPFTNRLSKIICSQSLKFHKNQFSPANNTQSFTISQKLSKINLRLFKTREFTIPFIQLQDISNIISIADKGNIDYSKRIKTIRLVKRHFEPVTDQQSFKSQFDVDEFQQNKIQSVINSQQKQHKCTCYMIAKNLIWLVIFLMIILSMYIPRVSERVKNKDKQLVDLQILEYRIKEFITDFILFQRLGNITKDQFLTQHHEQIYLRAIENLQIKHSLQQNTRENYFKIIFNLQQYSSQLHSLLQVPINNNEQAILSVMTFSICYILLSLTTLLFILIIIIVYSSKNTLLNIFGFFLHIDEQIVLQLKRKCFFIKKAAAGNEYQLNPKDVNQSKMQNQQEGGGLLKKFKSFRNISRKTDFNYIIQSFILPLIAVIVIIVFININLSRQANIRTINNLKINLNKLKLQASLLILNSYLTKIQAISIPNEDFKSNLQQFTSQMTQLKQSTSNKTLKKVIDIFMTGNVCQQLVFHIEDGQCLQIGDGITRSGLLSAMDYLYSNIHQYNNNENISFEHYLTPMKLKHIILQLSANLMTTILSQLVQQQQSSLNEFIIIMFIIVILLLISQIIILLQYPFRYMQNQIKMTLTVIKIFQNIKMELKDKKI